jgi:glutaredoxin
MEIYRIYTIPNCKFCFKAKALCDDYGLEYDEIYIEKNEYIEKINKLVKSNNYIKTAPIICDSNNDFIGGYNKFERYLFEKHKF